MIESGLKSGWIHSAFSFIYPFTSNSNYYYCTWLLTSSQKLQHNRFNYFNLDSSNQQTNFSSLSKLADLQPCLSPNLYRLTRNKYLSYIPTPSMLFQHAGLVLTWHLINIVKSDIFTSLFCEMYFLSFTLLETYLRERHLRPKRSNNICHFCFINKTNQSIKTMLLAHRHCY